MINLSKVRPPVKVLTRDRQEAILIGRNTFEFTKDEFPYLISKGKIYYSVKSNGLKYSHRYEHDDDVIEIPEFNPEPQSELDLQILSTIL